ncbi:hypothetical protein PHLCEN_2v9015 [Hermanssonia centrifuga]|uniref:Uncharacterized protein n=1 Tax=Hermanssonia centrifuga TaxID=98765 RepID=A0A2R6NS92_9APHY|nr:hypothetical protein PHLCEN_2v9015 [Hermanssonia centrifuga]
MVTTHAVRSLSLPTLSQSQSILGIRRTGVYCQTIKHIGFGPSSRFQNRYLERVNGRGGKMVGCSTPVSNGLSSHLTAPRPPFEPIASPSFAAGVAATVKPPGTI